MSAVRLREALDKVAHRPFDRLDEDDIAAVTEALEALRAGAEILRPEDLFAPAQAADFLGVNRTTVSRWKRQGYMPKPFQDLGIAGTWTLWTRKALEDFKRRHEAESDSAGRRTPAGAGAAT